MIEGDKQGRITIMERISDAIVFAIYNDETICYYFIKLVTENQSAFEKKLFCMDNHYSNYSIDYLVYMESEQ